MPLPFADVGEGFSTAIPCIGIGTIYFERESGKPFRLKEVMHVPGLKKNLISMAMLEDKGYDVVFSEGKAFLRSKVTGETRRIGV